MAVAAEANPVGKVFVAAVEVAVVVVVVMEEAKAA